MELVSLRELEYLLGADRKYIERLAETVGRFYNPFDVRRPGTKKWRHIDNPTHKLKAVQDRIQRKILSPIPLPDAMFGAVAGRSIKGNALVHKKPPALVTVDIRDCFPSINARRVYRVFIEHVGCSPRIAALLTRLTTIHQRLPQGAPTSPTIANLSLIPLEREVANLANDLGLRHSFFVDDIAISGERAREAVQPLIALIKKHGHAVRYDKVRVMGRNEPMLLTGTIINRKVGTTRSRRYAIRHSIFELAMRTNPSMKSIRSLLGKIAQAKWVCQEQGESLERLAARLLPAVGGAAEAPVEPERRRCHCASRHASRRGFGQEFRPAALRADATRPTRKPTTASS